MSWDWAQFFEQAKALQYDALNKSKLPGEREALLRTAASRAYYAAFHIAEDWAVRKTGYQPLQNNPHQRLIDQLENGSPAEKQVATNLRRARASNHARRSTARDGSALRWPLAGALGLGWHLGDRRTLFRRQFQLPRRSLGQRRHGGFTAGVRSLGAYQVEHGPPVEREAVDVQPNREPGYQSAQHEAYDEPQSECGHACRLAGALRVALSALGPATGEPGSELGGRFRCPRRRQSLAERER